jgi:hypothetical protein
LNCAFAVITAHITNTRLKKDCDGQSQSFAAVLFQSISVKNRTADSTDSKLRLLRSPHRSSTAANLTHKQSIFTVMQTPAPAEVLAAIDVLRQYSSQLKSQVAVTNPPATNGIPNTELQAIKERILAGIQMAEAITAKLLVLTEELKFQQALGRSHDHSH